MLLKKFNIFFGAIFYYGFVVKTKKTKSINFSIKIRKNFFFKSLYKKKIKKFLEKIIKIKTVLNIFFLISVIDCRFKNTSLF